MAQKISLTDWQQQRGRSSDAPVTAADDSLVYRTDTGTVQKAPTTHMAGTAYPDGTVRLKREKKGRGGKTVLTISGIAKPEAELVELCAALKKKCACGGAVKAGVIEIQADKRQLIEQHLSQLGFIVKWAGG
ncbi:translation initiation factor [Arsukibacterium sp. MJ3]|uniref:translation initiation factor n=1 Tax=Arsukibacterium sp. MJ3 TaxID=1632859 RepID=UPI0009E3A5DE|nr:translation initiation factor [Arsukibacterium sp. MJ3]